MERPSPEPGRDSSSRSPRCTAAARAAGSRPGPSSSMRTKKNGRPPAPRWASRSADTCDLSARPLAGVVEQIADEVGEVLRLAAKAQAVEVADRKFEPAFVVDLVKSARQRFDDRLQLRRGAGGRRARRRASAVEVEADLAGHHARLLVHFFGKRRTAGFRLVDQHAERRFQRMREVADLGAGAFDDFTVGVEQQVDLGGERRDVLGKLAHDPYRFAAADRRQPLAQRAQRPQSEPHRQRRRADQRHRRG